MYRIIHYSLLFFQQQHSVELYIASIAVGVRDRSTSSSQALTTATIALHVANFQFAFCGNIDLYSSCCADACAKIRASSAPYLNPLCIRPHDDDDDDDGPLEE
jgi:hypothetical protein